jgi:hypothetical protein
MASEWSGTSLSEFRLLFRGGSVVALSDRQLLERFVHRRDEAGEAAFAALVRRHGPMVWGVCRRLLRDPADASDAFQATFIVLVRRAGSVRVHDSLGPWLHGASVRVALRTRRSRPAGTSENDPIMISQTARPARAIRPTTDGPSSTRSLPAFQPGTVRPWSSVTWRA